MEDVITLETPLQEMFSADLSSIMDKARDGDKKAKNYLEKLWNEKWKNIKEKVTVEGSIWYIWWIDGVNQHLINMKTTKDYLTDKQIDVRADEYMTEIQSNTYAYDKNTSWQYSDVIEAFREGAKWARTQDND